MFVILFFRQKTAYEMRISDWSSDVFSSDRSHQNRARAWEQDWMDNLVTPFRGVERDSHLRPDSTVEKLAKLKPVFGKGEAATMTAGNSTPLSDGASAVLLASEAWAEERGLPVLAYLNEFQPSAGDNDGGDEGLRMHPTDAVYEVHRRAGSPLP